MSPSKFRIVSDSRSQMFLVVESEKLTQKNIALSLGLPFMWSIKEFILIRDDQTVLESIERKDNFFSALLNMSYVWSFKTTSFWAIQIFRYYPSNVLIGAAQLYDGMTCTGSSISVKSTKFYPLQKRTTTSFSKYSLTSIRLAQSSTSFVLIQGSNRNCTKEKCSLNTVPCKFASVKSM